MKISGSKLANNSDLEFGDFNVFIGGNGVGKTTFLLELHAISTGLKRKKFFWISALRYSSDDIGSDLQLLESSMSRKWADGTLFYFSRAAKDINGGVDLSNTVRFSEDEMKVIMDHRDVEVFETLKYRKPFIVLSSADARLGLPNMVEISGFNDPPTDPINVLYRNRSLLGQIDQTIQDRFEYNFILLDHTKRQLELGIANESPPKFDQEAKDLQDEFLRVEQWKDLKFTPLSESGHGIRSMIRLLTSMFEPVNKVVMIDEPEIHLYPSQKRWLGKQLVKLAKTQSKQVFLVTHDPIVLQGILDAGTTTKIYRIERERQNAGAIKSCELKGVGDITAQGNQDQYLQGLFYQRCIVVEGASDRSFYQNMTDDYPSVADKDLGFVACGGKGGTKHMAMLASKVGLKCAFIYDFDVILFQTDLVKDIFVCLGGEGNPLIELENLFEEVPGIRNATDEKERNKEIKKLIGYKNKAGLTSQWSMKNKQIFDNATKILESVGVFLVPTGTLESWAPEVEPKIRFAELAPDAIRKAPDLREKIDSFLKKVFSYLLV